MTEAAKNLPVAHPTIEQGMLTVIERAALNPDVDTNKMEKLLDMQERIINKNSEAAFHAAMADLQAELPMISEEGEIRHGGKLISKYAKFEDINNAVRPILAKHGFSISFRSDFPDGQLSITGVISHREGHHEETTMLLPFDTSGSKNNVQAIGSSVSYGKRYVLCMLLNISTGDMKDDDGQAAGPTPITEEQAADLQSLIEEGGRKVPDFLRWASKTLKGDFKTLEQLPAIDYERMVAFVQQQNKKSA